MLLPISPVGMAAQADLSIPYLWLWCSYSPDSINIFTEMIQFAGTVIDLILQQRKGEGLWRQKTLVWQKACWEVSSRRIRNPLNKCLLDMTLSPPV